MYIKLIDNPQRSSKRERIAGLLTYITNPGNAVKGEKCIHSEAVNLCGDAPKSWMMQQLELAERSRSPNPFWHIVISERTKSARNRVKDRRKLVEALMDELDMRDHQAVWAMHDDTSHPHLHLVINRVNPVSEKIVEVNHGWHIKGLKKALYNVCQKQGYEIEPEMPVHDPKGKRLNLSRRKEYSQSAQKFERYHQLASAERIARLALAPLAKQARSWAELHRLFQDKNALLIRKGRGLVIKLGGQEAKASDMGRHYSRAALEARLGPFEDKAASPAPAAKETNYSAWQREQMRKKKLRDAWYAERDAAYKRFLKKQLADIRDWAREEREAIRRIAEEHDRSDLMQLFLLVTSDAAFRRVKAREQARHWKQKQELPKELRHQSWRDYMADLAQHRNGLHGLEEWQGAIPQPGADMGQSVLAAYRLRLMWGTKGVCYQSRDGRRAFYDRGQQIIAGDDVTDRDILAMLYLAEERFPKGFEPQGSEEWKARARKIAQQHGISFDGWGTGTRNATSSPSEQVKRQMEQKRLEQQAAQNGKPPYMYLAYWNELPESHQEAEKEERLLEAEKKRELSSEAFRKWLEEKWFEAKIYYDYDKACQDLLKHRDDPTIQAAFKKAEKGREDFEAGILSLGGRKEEAQPIKKEPSSPARSNGGPSI